MTQKCVPLVFYTNVGVVLKMSLSDSRTFKIKTCKKPLTTIKRNREVSFKKIKMTAQEAASGIVSVHHSVIAFNFCMCSLLRMITVKLFAMHPPTSIITLLGS